MRERKKDLAYQAIKSMILSKKLTSEQFLSENDLAKKLNISRTPVREALLRLKSEGFIRIIPHKGAVINEVSIVEAREIFDMRMAIEEFVVRNVADQLEPEHFAILDRLIDQQEQASAAKDLESYLAADSEFHDFFLRLYRNRVIWDAVLHVRQRFLTVGISVLVTPKDIEISLQYHKDMVEALRRGDVEEAVRITHDHLKFGKANLFR
ncbi:MAG: hypothetical protein CSA35_01395 [Dethiosulfovibrio peptidovorans]|nr:MAG: hypothetical protein CSA35_01395 [Dethiosulfovibrio peptidovorans]